MIHLKEALNRFSKDELYKLVETFAKNWLTMDGCWFLAAEEEKGMDFAIKLDEKAWQRFSKSEAERIMRNFGIKRGGGLDSLVKAFDYRTYTFVNDQEVIYDKNKVILKMKNCKVQEARKRGGRPDFPCKSVGIIEYTVFAKTIDPRIEVKCIACPPDPHPDDYFCAWEFYMSK